MDEDDDFDYNDLDGVVFDEEVPSTPEQGLEEPQTGAVVVAAATMASRPARTRSRSGTRSRRSSSGPSF